MIKCLTVFTKTLIAGFFVGVFLIIGVIGVKAYDNSLTLRLTGRILLQVESKGEAWYLNTNNNQRYYMKDGNAAYNIMRSFGLGIANSDIQKIPVGVETRFQGDDSDADGLSDKLEEGLGTDPRNNDSDNDGYKDGDEVLNNYTPLGNGKLAVDLPMINRLKGKILLQVEARGQAWYLNPGDSKRYYLQDGAAAFQIMRYLGLGITNLDLEKIPDATGLIIDSPITKVESELKKCSDGTLYDHCSVDRPKYCSNGNLIDKASLCSCPYNYGINNDACTQLIDTAETIIFREQSPGQFFTKDTQNDIYWSINRNEFYKEFYKKYADSYDFVALFPTKHLRANDSAFVNTNVQGVGLPTTSPYQNIKKLKSSIAVDLYDVWGSLSSETINRNMLYTIIHEIGHHWCCSLNGVGAALPGHWTNNLDLFNGDINSVDLMGYYQWIINDGQKLCINGNDPAVEKKFSNLTLYTMGLIPPEKVGPIYLHEFEQKSDNANFNIWGPSCLDEHKFMSTRTITIQDIITSNGKRIPTYTESQKNFRVAFVILTEQNTVVPASFIAYLEMYKQALPANWSAATLGNSSLSF